MRTVLDELAPKALSDQSGSEDTVSHVPHDKGVQMSSCIIENTTKGTRSTLIACVREIRNDHGKDLIK